jgi:hypothetical protein
LTWSAASPPTPRNPNQKPSRPRVRGLLAVIAAEAATDHPQPTRRRAPRTAGRMRPRRLLAGSAVVAAVLTAALVAPLLLQRPATVPPPASGTGTHPPGCMPSAQPTVDGVLTAAALAAARAPAPRFGSAHRSVAELEADLTAWIDAWNQDPKPFVWTKTADQILGSLASHLQRINNSAH